MVTVDDTVGLVTVGATETVLNDGAALQGSKPIEVEEAVLDSILMGLVVILPDQTGGAVLGATETGSALCGSTQVVGILISIGFIMGLPTYPLICCLSQSLIPTGSDILGSMTYCFGGTMIDGIFIGSKVSGVIIGGGGTTGTTGWGGVGSALEPDNKQHNNPNRPNNPSNPGHHFQQSFDCCCCYLSITIGAGAGVAGRSITITLVFGLF